MTDEHIQHLMKLIETKQVYTSYALLKKIPLNRFGRSEEIAKIATFLASENAKYITGQIITADGGLVM